MSYAHCVIDFTLNETIDLTDLIEELDRTNFDNGIVQSEVYTKKDIKYIRIYVLLRNHHTFWDKINENTNEVTITTQSNEKILAKAYLHSKAPKFN
jgi:hypothetical protein